MEVTMNVFSNPLHFSWVYVYNKHVRPIFSATCTHLSFSSSQGWRIASGPPILPAALAALSRSCLLFLFPTLAAGHSLLLLPLPLPLPSKTCVFPSSLSCCHLQMAWPRFQKSWAGRGREAWPQCCQLSDTSCFSSSSERRDWASGPFPIHQWAACPCPSTPPLLACESRSPLWCCPCWCPSDSSGWGWLCTCLTCQCVFLGPAVGDAPTFPAVPSYCKWA